MNLQDNHVLYLGGYMEQGDPARSRLTYPRASYLEALRDAEASGEPGEWLIVAECEVTEVTRIQHRTPPLREIWREGYNCNGNRDGAHLFGQATGDTFLDACKNLAKVDSVFSPQFDAKDMTWWGCRLFDNETDARRMYG